MKVNQTIILEEAELLDIVSKCINKNPEEVVIETVIGNRDAITGAAEVAITFTVKQNAPSKA